LRQWYGLAEALGDALYDSQALRSFAGIDWGAGYQFQKISEPLGGGLLTHPGGSVRV
jgi:hypothetical protein